MARDKRGQSPEPDVDKVLDELAADDSDAHVAGPTSRNESGDLKRAAAKAVGAMGASKKIDPELASSDPDGGRPKSGSKAGLHSFQEVPPGKAGEMHLEIPNETVAQGANTTAVKSPAPRSAQSASTGPDAGGIGPGGRARIPAPGAAVSAPKGDLVRGHPAASRSGGREER